MSPTLRKRLRAVRLFLCDVDGVLTDAAVWMGGGMELKRFNIRDGLSLRYLQRFGIKVGWVSRRPSAATTQRAQDLKIDYLRQVDGDKIPTVEALLAETGFTWEDLCYVGDDIVDLGVLRRAAVAVVPADAVPETREVAHYVTRAPGGHGAVRETAELILKAQQKWSLLLKERAA